MTPEDLGRAVLKTALSVEGHLFLHTLPTRQIHGIVRTVGLHAQDHGDPGMVLVHPSPRGTVEVVLANPALMRYHIGPEGGIEFHQPRRVRLTNKEKVA